MRVVVILKKVYVHCFLDGRDTPPQSAKGFAQDLEDEMKKIGVGKIASVSGRYYAMDRDNNYDRVQIAYNALTKSEGNEAESATAGIQASYDDGKTDEFVVPFVVKKNGTPVAAISDKDSVVFFNFRPDRARETYKLNVKSFSVKSLKIIITESSCNFSCSVWSEVKEYY